MSFLSHTQKSRQRERLSCLLINKRYFKKNSSGQLSGVLIILNMVIGVNKSHGGASCFAHFVSLCQFSNFLSSQTHKDLCVSQLKISSSVIHLCYESFFAILNWRGKVITGKHKYLKITPFTIGYTKY